jgi:hypothetical protein
MAFVVLTAVTLKNKVFRMCRRVFWQNFTAVVEKCSMMNQQMRKCSTIYYITLGTIPLHVSTLLRHPQGVRVQCLPSYIST